MNNQPHLTELGRLGYWFDDSGVLRDVDERKFVFTTQEQYEEVGEAVTEEIYELLETKCGLIKTPLKPIDKPDEIEEDLSFIYVSPDCQKKEILLVLFHGSGVVRAGQWARRLCINNSLRSGSQMSYIIRAQELGWGVVVMNTNECGSLHEGYKYSGTPTEHALTAWNAWVANSENQKIYVVAHSRGGADISEVLKRHGSDERVTAICLTDSWFRFSEAVLARQNPLIVINFSAHGLQFDPEHAVKDFAPGQVQSLFAGTNIHEWTSHCAIDAIFNIFLREISLQNYRAVIEESKTMVAGEDESEEDPEEDEQEESSSEESVERDLGEDMEEEEDDGVDRLGGEKASGDELQE